MERRISILAHLATKLYLCYHSLLFLSWNKSCQQFRWSPPSEIGSGILSTKFKSISYWCKWSLTEFKICSSGSSRGSLPRPWSNMFQKKDGHRKRSKYLKSFDSTSTKFLDPPLIWIIHFVPVQHISTVKTFKNSENLLGNTRWVVVLGMKISISTLYVLIAQRSSTR